MGRRLGIIIGVNTYQDAAFRRLHYAENDARALAQWLVNAKGGSWEPADLQLVQGAYATRELVESLVHQVCINVAGPGDLLLLYFAGQAFISESNGDGYLAFSNTQYARPAETAVHLPTLARLAMGASRAAGVVCIFDTFQSGPIWQIRRASPFDARPLLGPSVLNALQQTSDRFALCSCRGNEQNPEVGEKSLGTFVYHMILGLCGPASDPATHRLTLKHLHAFLLNALTEQQRPQLFGQECRPVVLVGEMPGLTTPPPPGKQEYEQVALRPGAPEAQQAAMGTLLAQDAAHGPAASGPSSGPPTEQQQCAMLVKQARHLIKMSNPQEAFNLVEQALRLVRTDLTALILKGQLLGTVGRFEEALYVVGLVLQLDPDNALPWSMRAALLTNSGQLQLALQAIERSLELDPNNPETYSIKTSIMGQVAAQQSQSQKLPAMPGAGPASFWPGVGMQVLGLLIGVGGAVLPLILPAVPATAVLALQSLGLALLCIYAARGAYLFGFVRFFVTIFIAVITAASLAVALLLGGALHIGKGRVYTLLQNHPKLLLPLLFLGGWLAAAVLLPVIVALFGLIVGAIRKKS